MYMYLHVYIYIHMIYIIYKYFIYKRNIFFLNIYMHVCVFIYTLINIHNTHILDAINHLTALIYNKIKTNEMNIK